MLAVNVHCVMFNVMYPFCTLPFSWFFTSSLNIGFNLPLHYVLWRWCLCPCHSVILMNIIRRILLLCCLFFKWLNKDVKLKILFVGIQDIFNILCSYFLIISFFIAFFIAGFRESCKMSQTRCYWSNISAKWKKYSTKSINFKFSAGK